MVVLNKIFDMFEGILDTLIIKLRRCDYYNKEGHVKKSCHKLVHYPANFKASRKMLQQRGLCPRQME